MVPILAVGLVVASVVALGLVRTAVEVGRSTAAQAAADAAALAGAEDGRSGAERAAQANQARLVAFRQDHLDVEVTVTRHGHTASARARWLPAHHHEESARVVPPASGPASLGGAAPAVE